MRAKLKAIPAYIKTVDDENLMEMALVENIQRQDLNAIEIALAYQQLIEQYGLTQEKLAEKVGKKRATVATFLRLLKLPAPVQIGLRNGLIDTGHARALLAIDDPKKQVKAYNETVNKGLSVRMVEQMVKKEKNTTEGKKKQEDDGTAQMTRQMAEQIQKALNTKAVVVADAKGKGKITISFDSIEQASKIIEKLT